MNFGIIQELTTKVLKSFQGENVAFWIVGKTLHRFFGFICEVLKQELMPLDVGKVFLVVNNILELHDKFNPKERATIEGWQSHLWKILSNKIGYHSGRADAVR